MHLATAEAIRRTSRGQALALTASYSLWYDKNASQLTPTQNLGLWKPTVLLYFFQNLRYIQSTLCHSVTTEYAVNKGNFANG